MKSFFKLNFSFFCIHVSGGIQEGDFVIYSAPNEAYTTWPDSNLIIPYFIGQIVRIDTDGTIHLT